MTLKATCLNLKSDLRPQRDVPISNIIVASLEGEYEKVNNALVTPRGCNK
jgi:hypothetical protein